MKNKLTIIFFLISVQLSFAQIHEQMVKADSSWAYDMFGDGVAIDYPWAIVGACHLGENE